MTNVCKYNTLKAFSTVLTFATPLVTMACVGESFIKEPSAAISGAATLALLLSAFFAKDKIMEKFKCPSALIVALIIFVFCVVVESIIKPIKIISLTTIIACGVDELTFKNFYKRTEQFLPAAASAKKMFGFYACRQKTIDSMGGSV